MLCYSTVRVWIRINRGSFSFNCSQTYGKTALQKQWSSSEFLNCFVYVKAHRHNNSLKRIISSSNFVAIAWLVVLVMRDPGTTGPLSSLLYRVTLTCIVRTLWALREVNVRKPSSIGTCPTSLLSASTSPNCVFIVFFSFCMPEILL